MQVFSGVQDAMVQWWYGHNAVGFFLTAGFLGMMYYFVPKQAERPVYSYKLSIVHFWALIFLYIWAGPHHLHYTALPTWTSTLGMVFSIMLWMPSWGGMINGLMTLSGAWDKLRTDPIIRMMVVSIGFYGMSTFEGPMMSIKAVNSLSHYTDWTIGHVHSGALGWNGMITFGALYFLTPKLWNKERLYSLSLVSWHFWLATIGIVLYASSMWVSGIMEGLMWREVDANGFLVNAFADTVAAKFPMNVVRGLGGVLYPHRCAHHVLQPVENRDQRPPRGWCAPRPFPLSEDKGTAMGILAKHKILETNATLLLIFSFFVVTIGGLVQIVPLFYLENTIEKVEGVRPYTPLELAGRDIYIREGCYVCHSQMIRPMRDETERYGHYSLAAESMYDHPFQWGSKRTGPDLARVGERYSDEWHVDHPDQPAVGGAGIDHAQIRVPLAHRDRRPLHPRPDVGAPDRGRALQRRDARECRRRLQSAGQPGRRYGRAARALRQGRRAELRRAGRADGDGRPHLLPAGAGHDGRLLDLHSRR